MPLFPVVDIRRNVDGTWNSLSTSQSITVPSSSPYTCTLNEIPDNGAAGGSSPSISGLTLISTYPPASGQFYVNFATGVVEFNSAQAGNTYTITYSALGTLIQAYHINWLKTNHADIQGTPTAGEITSWVDSDTIQGISTIDLGVF